jgi:hypothetical protein
MRNFIVYDKDGNILRTGSCMEDDFALQADIGEYVDEGKADDTKQFMNKHKLEDKAVAPALTKTGNVLTNLPKPCTVWIDDKQYVIKDGTADLSALPAGKYKIRIDSAAYLKHEEDIIL